MNSVSTVAMAKKKTERISGVSPPPVFSLICG